MGVHFLSLFLVATSNTLVAMQILKYVNLMDLAMVAVYLPASARNILAHGKKHITEMMFKHSPFAHKINVERLQHQLRICRFGLFNELLALEPYTNSVLIDTLDFLDYNCF